MKKENKKKSFEEYLQEKMLASDWMNLASILHVTLDKRTRFMNNPHKEATVDIMKELCKLVKVHPAELFREYQVGMNLKMLDFEEMNSWYEKYISE